MAVTGHQCVYARLSGGLTLNLTLLSPAVLSQQECSPRKDEGAYVWIFICIQGSNSSFDPTTASPQPCKGSRKVWQWEDHPLGTRVAMSFPLPLCIDYTPRDEAKTVTTTFQVIPRCLRYTQILASPFPNIVSKRFPSSAKKRSPIP